MVEVMAKAVDGLKDEGRQGFVVVNLEGLQPRFQHDTSIREALAANKCVVLKGVFLEGPTNFTKEEIAAEKGSLEQMIQYHGTLLG